MIDITGKKAFRSIQAVLRQDKPEVRLAGFWQAIHEELSVGVRLPGGVLRLDGEDRDRLREYIRRQHGLDPLLDELDGDRVELAACTSNEKFSAQPVFGRLLRLVSRRPDIHLTTGRASTPPGSALILDPSLITAESLDTMVVIVENGAVFSRWHDVPIADSQAAEALAIYRGHDQEARVVADWLTSLPDKVSIVAAVDFDPAGFEIALALGASSILLPVDWPNLPLDASMNKVRAFDEQYRPQLIERIPEGWLQAYEWVVSQRAAFTQEALLARDVPLQLLVR
ncbi:MAG: hypothetical protein GY802_01125 [Gammaproteobacteria bacterium]|nr:hypothetical protein [Gammaproteobacteria bacterium]